MRIKEISYLGTISILITSLVIAASCAAIASILLGLSLAETIFSTTLIVLILLITHMVFMLSLKSEHSGEASLDQKVNYIAAEITALRKQQAYLRQHFDHELKYMHGLNRATDDNLRLFADNIETSLANLLRETEQINAGSNRLNIDQIRQNQKSLFDVTFDQDIEMIEKPIDAGRVTDDGLVELLNQSLADNKVDLYAQPIVSLPERHIVYYESYTWVRDGNGKVITPREYLATAERAGIMPVIDNLMLFRSVLLAKRFVERNRQLKIFCNISGHSLLDVTFFDEFIDFMTNNQDQSDMLIFEFSQHTLSETGIIESEALLSLMQLGFRFSLDNVTDLNLDFRKLHLLGFRYIKISANIFLNNAEAHGAQILIDDFAEHVRRSGLELIVDEVQNEHIVPELLEYKVKYAQGYLFGEPTLVRDKSHLLHELKQIA
ncbi:MAG: EAL domain-containing protein [Rhizobiales bacterium]|nr:EAL domain-containing protein [Hyphomicrobiales bacterium]NRB13553.1 EAL domain-containing protein [Hyphomicrobiales bacterium]